MTKSCEPADPIGAISAADELVLEIERREIKGATPAGDLGVFSSFHKDRIGFGDVPLVLTRAVRDEDAEGPGVALRVGVELPTGSEDRGFGVLGSVPFQVIGLDFRRDGVMDFLTINQASRDLTIIDGLPSQTMGQEMSVGK